MDKWRRTLFCALVAFPAALHGRHILPGPHFFACEALADAVHLSWDMLGIDPELHAARLFRDGELIGDLSPDALAFFDAGLPPGRHGYRLDIVGITEDPERLIASVECEAEVPQVPGIRCEVFPGIAVPPEVFITWDPLPGGTSGVLILRDVEPVAELSGKADSYVEEPLSGDHLYTVIALGIEGSGEDTPIGSCLASYEPPVIGGFVRGDGNADGQRDVSDIVSVLLFLFREGAELRCRKSADVDDSGELDLTDAVYVASFLFRAGPPPPAPFPSCGEDPTPDDLTCDEFPPCFHPPPP